MTPRQQDAILWKWSTTLDTAEEIGRSLGVSKGAVLGFLHRRRKAGDPRATIRRPDRAKEPQTLEQRIAILERTIATIAAHQQREAA